MFVLINLVLEDKKDKKDEIQRILDAYSVNKYISVTFATLQQTQSNQSVQPTVGTGSMREVVISCGVYTNKLIYKL